MVSRLPIIGEVSLCIEVRVVYVCIENLSKG